MAEVVSTVRRRVDPTPLTAVVAVGDVLLIALWIAVGMVQHNNPPWNAPVRMVGNLLPFLVAWAITAFVGGLYTRDAWEFPIRAVSWTMPAWITTVLIAQVLRALPVFPGNADPAFALVSMGVGLVVLLPWRAAVSVYDNR